MRVLSQRCAIFIRSKSSLVIWQKDKLIMSESIRRYIMDGSFAINLLHLSIGMSKAVVAFEKATPFA